MLNLNLVQNQAFSPKLQRDGRVIVSVAENNRVWLAPQQIEKELKRVEQAQEILPKWLSQGLNKHSLKALRKRLNRFVQDGKRSPFDLVISNNEFPKVNISGTQYTLEYMVPKLTGTPHSKQTIKAYIDRRLAFWGEHLKSDASKANFSEDISLPEMPKPVPTVDFLIDPLRHLFYEPENAPHLTKINAHEIKEKLMNFAVGDMGKSIKQVFQLLKDPYLNPSLREHLLGTAYFVMDEMLPQKMTPELQSSIKGLLEQASNIDAKPNQLEKNANVVERTKSIIENIRNNPKVEIVEMPEYMDPDKPFEGSSIVDTIRQKWAGEDKKPGK